MLTRMERRKPGPVGKGERELARLRLPKPLKTAAFEEAHRRGMTFNDLVGELLAEATGTPYSQQGSLRLLPSA